MFKTLEIEKSEIVFQEQGYKALANVLFDNNWSKIFILCDENSKESCLKPFLKKLGGELNFILIEVKSGEKNKNIETCSTIWQGLCENSADRKALFINLGGGVICDIGGFSAACYMRGIAFVNIPTTLLSQVDASVGGKTGVDLKGLKNLVGLFCLPKLTLIDSSFCSTLPKIEYLSGFAEMIKHGLIADKKYFETLSFKTNFSDSELAKLIYRSVEIKHSVVCEDFNENGKRKTLNFGHTISHAIESYFLGSENELRHGIALAYGMVIEAYLSNIPEAKQIKSYIFNLYGEKHFSEKQADRFINIMLHDKKNISGKMNFSLLKTLGNCGWDNFLDEDKIKRAILSL